ncbi:MAG TPA: hypothetical protein VKF36_21490 [Syntrophorhabdales bacterium]|nr:hypothetical protein [Syntrophorhabdales bacterium]
MRDMKTAKLSSHGTTFLSLFLIALSVAHTACAPGPQDALHAEGEYYGKETVAFSLLMTPDRFIKSYSNGVTVTGTKTAQGPIYYFVKSDGRLVVKVSQDNLYRIGEMTNWETMTRLIRFIDGAGLVRENRTDTENSCRWWYSVEKEKVRLCMNEPVQASVLRGEQRKNNRPRQKMSYTKASVNPRTVVDHYLKDGYQFVDADEDISPDTD